MAVTAAQIAQVRRMVAEPTTATYSDDAIEDYIEARSVPDQRGIEPFELDFTTTPPTQDENPDWIPTYDLNAAAADILDEKAAAAAQDYAFSADGANYSRNQVHEQYRAQAQRFRSRSVPGGIQWARRTRAVTATGAIVETVPIVDRLEDDGVVNN